ncbi:hypothetical protein [Methylobacterium nonmethylotrophicum]|uniref:Uncharacterized protein n=1 Tax=Methylobacterium nonmethylotrophicum TaxID=1141884 RepID=A0A4Z0NET0_9HYPH|nr:hypothetical protein [Methylobacterium nonmethylotrophicum]TGD94075.1 hypothetical protein EU555_32675 [Methylobacterium nonmethylotrophicum]
MSARRIVYSYRDDGTTRFWSIPYHGEEPANAVHVEYDPGAAVPWTAHYALGGWPRAAIEPADIERVLAGVELRDNRGWRIR